MEHGFPNMAEVIMFGSFSKAVLSERHHPGGSRESQRGKCLVFEGFMDYLSFPYTG